MQGQAPSGLATVPTIAWGSHLSQLFETGEDLRDLLVPYFKAGLENNEHCLWVTGEAFRAEQARSALRAAIPDLEARERSNQIEIRDYHEWYAAGAKLQPVEIVAGLLERERKALELGFRGVRTNGNCAWVQSDQWPDFRHYETLVHQNIRGRQMICMCSYCVADTTAAQLLDVIERHDFILPRRGNVMALKDAGEDRAAEDRNLTLAREMHHRLNNTLTLVQAIMRLSARHATTLEEFKRTFSARIDALAKTNSMLIGQGEPSVQLHELLGAELGMFVAEPSRITLDGAELSLPERLAVPVGMAIHELTTNAAKYGALSVPDGTLAVRWSRTGADIEVHWQERNVPRAGESTRTGFGTRLLNDILPRQTGGRFEMRYAESGLDARLIIPL